RRERRRWSARGCAVRRLGAAFRGAVGTVARRAGRVGRAEQEYAAQALRTPARPDHSPVWAAPVTDRDARRWPDRPSRRRRMSLAYPLVLSALLFSLGVFGVLARRNAVLVLVSVELMLTAANINLVAFDAWWSDALHGGR